MLWVNSNADEVELFLNGKTLGKKVMPRNSHLQWQVAYEPGSALKAIATKNGRTYEIVMETTGEAHQISTLTPDRNIVTADGKDATVVNVTVLDNKGREVPTANHLVAFSLEGDASIVGVGNGASPLLTNPDKMDVRGLQTVTLQWEMSDDPTGGK